MLMYFFVSFSPVLFYFMFYDFKIVEFLATRCHSLPRTAWSLPLVATRCLVLTCFMLSMAETEHIVLKKFVFFYCPKGLFQTMEKVSTCTHILGFWLYYWHFCCSHFFPLSQKTCSGQWAKWAHVLTGFVLAMAETIAPTTRKVYYFRTIGKVSEWMYWHA